MTAPPPERWQRIDQIADAALDRAPEERGEFLRAACGDDAELHAWVVKLLEAGEAEEGLMASAAAEYAPGLLRQAAGEANAAGAAGRRIGPYRILSELGRGGMGVVYLAERDEHFQQRVAIKVIRQGLHLDAQLLQRFVDERQILAKLEHPNIARLLDGGLTEDGVPWFAMELVTGEHVDHACDARRFSIEARLELFCTVCDAVEYAHQRQVVHRDLKPSNILVNERGDVKLVDFGISKIVALDPESERNLTRTGGRLLTPEYASPEQLAGLAASAASDVYSLGVLAYELLTGQRPYRVTGGKSEDGAQPALRREPVRPSTAARRTEEEAGRDASPSTATQRARARGTTPERLSERLRGDLDAIVLRALARDAQQRYASAAELAADVRRYLEGLPVARAPVRRAWLIAAAVTGTLALTAAAAALWSRWPAGVEHVAAAGAAPVLAVGLVTDYRGTAAAPLGGSVSDLLATNLGRVPELRVVSTARLLELMDASDDQLDAGDYSAAARRAGASMIVEGGLHSAGDELRLDLRRIDVRTGDVLAAVSVQSQDLFALVDSGTAHLASGVGARAPAGSIADVTTKSALAYRFYEEGLRTYYRGEMLIAHRLFEAAFQEDSTFALAAYYLAITGDPGQVSYAWLERAVRLADRASDRERLIIRTARAERASDPSALASAETLAVRYPQEPFGPLLSGRAHLFAEDYRGAIPRLRQVIAMDSAAPRNAGAQCAACDARNFLISAYVSLDSLAAAEREARLWVDLAPNSAIPWMRLHEIALARGDFDASRDAWNRAARLYPGMSRLPAYHAYHNLLEGDYAGTEQALRELSRSGPPDQRRDAIWYLTITLRWQGRFEEALRTIRSYPAPVGQSGSFDGVLLEGQVLLELGRPRESLALFDSLAHGLKGEIPPYRARFMTWALAHGASALAALGDTARLQARVDTIRTLGARSLLRRDQRMHHYVRGLLYAAQHRDDAAIEEFRSALTSPTLGYVRPSYELARALLRAGRPSEAIPVLQRMARVPVEAGQLYVTRTELRELLGDAWAAEGVADSAAVHYDAVLAAWSDADPILHGRIQVVRARRAALSRSAP